MFDLGALVTRMTVLGRSEFERDLDAGERAIARAAVRGDQFNAGITTASVSTVTFGQRVRVVGGELDALDSKGQAALNSVGRLGVGLVAAAVAIGALLGVAVAKFAEYDREISRAVAVTGAYGDELDRIRELTIGLGGATIFTAKEAAQGVVELGKAGVGTADILGGALKGSLDLAAAGELSVADAAQIASIAMTQFKLNGADVPHLADLLAAAAGKAQGSVGDLAFGFKQSGLVAAQMGLSVEETTGTLAAFASAGLLGSDAGTSFRTMLLNLATPTKQQSALLEQYNIHAYQNGQFVGIATLAAQLRAGGLARATQAERDYALGIIFGSDAIRAANVLYNQGEAGVRRWTANVNDAGYAARFAAEQQDNLAGDVEKLSGALDSAFIGAGSGANEVLRDLIQNVTKLVDGFSDLDAGTQESIVLGAALLSGTLLLAGGFALAIPRVVEFRASLAILAAQMPATAAAARGLFAVLTGPWGIAITLAVVTLAQLSRVMEEQKATSEELEAALIAQGRSARTVFETYAKGQLYVRDTGELFGRLQGALDQFDPDNWINFIASAQDAAVIDNLKRIGENLDNLADTDLAAAQDTFRDFAAETDGSEESLRRLLAAMPAFRDNLIAQATAAGDYKDTMSEADKNTVLLAYAMGDAAVTGAEAGHAYRVVNGVLQDVTQSVDDLIDGLRDLNDENIDQQEAAIRYQDALRDVSDALATNGATLDITTEAGARNRQALLDQADAAQTAADAALKVNGDYESYRATLEGSRDQLIANAEAFGASTEEAIAFADSVLRIPSKAEVQVVLLDQLARQRFDRFLSDYSNRLIPVSAVVRASDYNANGGLYSNNVRYFAGGGENHMAQIASAGSSIRVWAEPETEGEGYVPFALSKRQRSEQIMQQIAAKLGGVYIPSSAKRHANGDGADPAGQGLTGLRISGELMLPGGFYAQIDGMIEDAIGDQADARDRGYRAP